MGERQPLVGGRPSRPEEEVADFSYVAQRATQFNNEVTQLQRLADQVGTGRDSHQLRDQLHYKREDCANIAKTTLQLMKKMKITKSEKARHDKLISQINEIFNRYQKISQDSIQKERVTPLVSSEYNQNAGYQSQPAASGRGDRSFNPQPYRGDEEDREQIRAQQQVKNQSYSVEREIIAERDNELRGLESRYEHSNK
eukprot:TRINITY_DN2567_c0_g1_i2.p1 TRINITY_DN2567_c0_g1~~TRINITY_DN2567_c0_g1_i2.p1  ORF type:complete len:198 (-),score=32.96 TRINITY_DN2567_c0_g1_i2:39-632(-)